MKNFLLILAIVGFVFCGRSEANTQVPAGNVTVLVNTFSHCLTISDTNVQQALNDIDNCFANSSTQTPWLQNINASGYTLSDVGAITGTTGGNVNYKTVTCGNSTIPGTATGTGTTPSYTFVTAGKIITATLTGSLSTGNCSAVIDVWKTNSAIPTVANTITAAAYPTLSSSTYTTQSVATWTTTIAANDVIMCNVRSSTCDNWNLVLGIQE